MQMAKLRLILIFGITLSFITCVQNADHKHEKTHASITPPKTEIPANQPSAIILSPQFPSQTLKPGARAAAGAEEESSGNDVDEVRMMKVGSLPPGSSSSPSPTPPKPRPHFKPRMKVLPKEH